jgi:uncharacterized membrane protein YfcA
MEIQFNPLVALGWSVLAGFFMAMGAGGGGILAGIGHFSILGIGDANAIKVANQVLELASRGVSVPLYQRQGRMVWALALAYGSGAPVGAVLGSWVSKAYLSDLAAYRAVFGILLIAVAARLLYEAWGCAACRRGALKNARRPRLIRASLRNIRVGFAGEEFRFSPAAAALGGCAISFVGAMLGVGGGFLVTPFMASVLMFPMFLVVGTSLVAIMLPLLVSIATYLVLETQVNWMLIAVEVPGVAIGSLLAPAINRHLNENALRTFVAIVLLGVGAYYLL